MTKYDHEQTFIQWKDNTPAAFATTFIAACLYNLELEVRVAGVFLAGLSIYQGLLGKVPLTGPAWKTLAI